MTTANSTIDVKYVIPKTDTKVYTVDTVHIEIKNSDGTKLINTPAVTSQVANTSDGLVTFSAIQLAAGGNQIRMYLSDIPDLDGAPTIARLGSTYIRYIDVSPTEVTL